MKYDSRVIDGVVIILLMAFTVYAVTTLSTPKQKTVIIATVGELDHIILSPGEAEVVTVLAGETQDFNATGFDSEGSIVSMTETWSVLGDSEIGVIDNTTGLFSALTTGTLTVMATSAEVSGAATLNVVAATATNITVTATPEVVEANENSTATIIAQVLDDESNPVEGHTIEFTLSSGGGFVNATSTVTNSTGQAEALYTASAATGATVITVQHTTMEGLTSNVSITVGGDATNIQLSAGWNLISLPLT